MKKLLFAGVGIYVSLFSSSLHAQSGSLDITFNPGTGANAIVNAIALQPDGKVLIAGNFTAVNNITRKSVARLNSDGSLDLTFDPGDGPNGGVSSLALQSDGQILIGGGFPSVDGVVHSGMARLRTDGSLDTTLNFGSDASGISGTPLSIVVQTNAQIIVAGNLMATFNGTNHANIARISSNGFVDTTFNVGTGADSTIFTIAIQSDGKILAGGQFANFNGTNRSCLVRLNPDGSSDTNFNPSPLIAVFPFVRCLAVQTDGKVLIGGGFVSINGYTRHNIARLNVDGSLDLTFNSSTGATVSSIDSIVLQPDGKILAAGYQSGYNATVLRLNSDGSLDNNFNAVAVRISAYEVKKMLLQPDGKILICGDFTGINSTNIHGIARLNGDSPVSTTLNLLSPQIYFGMNLSGVVSNVYRIEYTSKFNTPSLWTPLFNVTLQTNPQFILDPNPAGGQRFYRAVSLP